MDASIRIKPKIKEIEVNDNGDCIYIKTSDPAFINRLVEIMKYSKENADRLQKDFPCDSLENVQALTKASVDVCSKIAADIDELFGDEVCRKTFGSGTPDFGSLAEFFKKISEITKQNSSGVNAPNGRTNFKKNYNRRRKKGR